MAFFASLQRQSEILKASAPTVQSLIANVQLAWRDYPWETLDRIHGVLYEIYRLILQHLILQHEGDNDFKLPHSHVRERQAQGLDTTDVFVPKKHVVKAEKILKRYEAIKK